MAKQLGQLNVEEAHIPIVGNVNVEGGKPVVTVPWTIEREPLEY